MSESITGTLNLHGQVPSEAEIAGFINVMFRADERDLSEKLGELLQLVYHVTRTSGVTIYQESELTPAIGAGRDYGVSLDTLTNTWVIVVPRGKEYCCAMDALRYIIGQG